MKRFVVFVVLMVLALSLANRALGEVGMKGFGHELKDGEYVSYVVLESEDTGDTVKLYVSEDEVDSFLKEEFKRAEAEARDRKIQEVKNWFGKAADTVVFWK